jgi:acetoin utilization protein AcuC
VGSGGYDWRRVVPRSWAILWAEMTDQTLPANLPERWRERWDIDPNLPLPLTFLDAPDGQRAVSRRHEIEARNREAVNGLHRALQSA